MQCKAMQRNAKQSKAKQSNAIQCNAIQCNSAQKMCWICVFCRYDSFDKNCLFFFPTFRPLTIHLKTYYLLTKWILHLFGLTALLLIVPIEDLPNSVVPPYLITLDLLSGNHRNKSNLVLSWVSDLNRWRARLSHNALFNDSQGNILTKFMSFNTTSE